MRGVKYIYTICVVLVLLVTTTSGQRCGRRLKQKNYSFKKLFPASILVTVQLSTSCINKTNAWPRQYHIRYGFNGIRHSVSYNVSSHNQSIILSDLTPNKKYEVYIIAEYDGDVRYFSRPESVMSANSTDRTNTTVLTNTTSVGDHDKANNVGGIAAGIIISLIAVMTVAVIISLWLIKRRRILINKNKGSHYVSVVSIIGNESLSAKKKLYSRPGYLQIFHDPKPAASYEVPFNSKNSIPSTTSDPASSEYPAANTEERPNSTDKDVMMLKPEPIELLSTNMTTSNVEDHKSVQGEKKKLVKPYAVVDVTDIATKAGLDDDKHKSKHQKNKYVPSNREALNHSFGSSAEDSPKTHQVELNGRFYTVPTYVNLHIPMTINPSYNK